jgi:hypothetical protein
MVTIVEVIMQKQNENTAQTLGQILELITTDTPRRYKSLYEVF